MLSQSSPRARCAYLAIVRWLFVACFLSSAADAAPTPLRVLLITGGCCHDYTAQSQLIRNGIESRAHVVVTVVEQGGRTTDTKIPLYKDPNWSTNYDVVIHDECFAEVKDAAWVQRILKPHQKGLPAVVIHCAMHCYRDGTDNWFKFCGVTSHRHGAQYGHEVLNRDGQHPIMQGWGAAWANPAGELYNIAKVWPTAHPLAATKDRASGHEEVCIWTNQYGKARVFGTTLGHHNETVEHPRFLDLLTRGTLWACDKLNNEYLKPAKPQRPQRVPVNLALKKTVTASSTQDGNLTPYAADGDTRTRWCASDASAPQWLQIDLGKTEKVTGCELKWEIPTTIYRYRLQGSTDKKNWTTVVDRGDNRDDIDHYHRFDAEMRYLRLVYLGSNTGHWGSLWEVAVYGTEMMDLASRGTRISHDKERLSGLNLPDGFQATVFATPPAVNYPTFVAAAPDGTLYVSVDKNGSLDRKTKRGAIYRLRDLDGDDRADEVKLFVPDVDSPRGIVWDHDRLYVMHPPHLSAFIDHDGDGHSDEQETLVKNIAFGFKDRPADHTSNGVTLGIDGWLYLAIGDFGFMDAEGTDGRHLQFRGGGVVRVRPDGTGLQVYAQGTRNILEVALDPLLNGFTRDNTNDGGGWDIRIHHFSGLEHHGYPSLFMNFTDEAVAPLADYGGGSGCGTLYMDEPGFPPGYGTALYTADWGRETVFRHHPTRNGATFTIDQDDFLRVPRVTDLDVDANSAIYVASWKGATFTYVGEEVGYLLKLRPSGYTAPPLPDFSSASARELWRYLESPSHRRRLEAQRALIRLGANPGIIAALGELAADDTRTRATRVAAIYALKQILGKNSHATLAELAVSSPVIRAWAIRAIADRWDEITDEVSATIQAGLTDPDPRVRLESVVAAARQGDDSLATQVAALLADKDPVVAHTAVRALVKLRAIDACLAVLDTAASSTDERKGALRVLQSLHDERVVTELIQRLDRTNDPDLGTGITSALCRLHFQEGTWKGNSWGTRPDTSGPYYQPETWSQSARIAHVLAEQLSRSNGSAARRLLTELSRHKIRLPDALDYILAATKTDPEMIPMAAAELARERTISPAGKAFLSALARDATADLELRASATGTLLRTGDEQAWSTALALAGSLTEKHGARSRQVTRLRDRFLRAKNLHQQVGPLIELAIANQGMQSLWAEAALLTFTKQDKSPAHQAAQESVTSGWNSPARREQVLGALLLADARRFEPQVREALIDPNPNILAAARRVAKRWKLEPRPTPATPLIKALPLADVLAAAAIPAGDKSHGQTIYERLDCKNCHTVSPDEVIRGPYLPNVARTYKRQQLAEAILQPSKTLAQGFVTTLFHLDDGTSVKGFITREAADEVFFRDATGKEHRVAVDEIEERVEQKISMMPDGLVNELTVDELAALVTYLQSLAELAQPE